MRFATFVHLSFFSTSVTANLLVPYKIKLNCNESSPAYTGCLRGMTCDDGETCIKPAIHIYADSLYSLRVEKLLPRQDEPQVIAAAPQRNSDGGPVTTDGTCGASNGGTICGNWEKGSCCSLFGVCIFVVLTATKVCSTNLAEVLW